ncbi:capsular polysaccharide synthesis protein [Sutterella wadsworthensis]|uniref:capsular polysaccharide synthesis protein n=1 Tax=Sutterella wadsworthensis TaxID=40545 RepID=UPI001C01CD54|nr:hypothetical protein [Sutterella wadsworthensis]
MRLKKIIANHLKTKYIKNKISQYQSSQNSDSTSENVVWQYWAQGIESSPEIIKICLESVNSYFSKHGYKVIQLNDKNIHEYLDKILCILRKHQPKEMASALPLSPISYV